MSTPDQAVDEAWERFCRTMGAVDVLVGWAIADKVRKDAGAIYTRACHGFADQRARMRSANDEVDQVTQKLRSAHEVILSQSQQIDRLSTELVRRYKRSNTPVPEWLQVIRSDHEAPF